MSAHLFLVFQIRQALKIVIQPSGSCQFGNQCFNIALVYLFMGYFQLDPADAVLGTIFAQTISVIVALVVIRCKQKGVRLRKADFKPNRNMLGGILSIRTFVYRLHYPALL
ncbi:hypothetical protein KHP57_20565, partial [Algiphilus sp. NNCM1]|nr:hypothetical protein [Algiphilus acroporae]